MSKKKEDVKIRPLLFNVGWNAPTYKDKDKFVPLLEWIDFQHSNNRKLKAFRSVVVSALKELNKALIREANLSNKHELNVSVAYNNARMYVKRYIGDEKK